MQGVEGTTELISLVSPVSYGNLQKINVAFRTEPCYNIFRGSWDAPHESGSERAKEVKIEMKEKIHPKYEKAIVRCVCGETFETGSTKKELRVEICSKCHPFFTGKQKLVDSGGRVDRFKKRFGI